MAATGAIPRIKQSSLSVNIVATHAVENGPATLSLETGMIPAIIVNP